MVKRESKTVEYFVYPNPAYHKVKVKTSVSDNEIVYLMLYDTQGKLIEKLYQGKIKAGQEEIELNLDHLDAGLYFLGISSKHSCYFEELLIIR